MLGILMKSLPLLFALLSTVKSFASDLSIKDDITSQLCGEKDLHKTVKIKTVKKDKTENFVYHVSWSLKEPETTPELNLPKLGESVEIIRCLSDGSSSRVGKGVVNINTNNTFQALVKSELDFAENTASYNDYKMPMTGDIIIPIVTNITQAIEITPIFKFSSSKLFLQSENQGGYSYELSTEGKSQIREAVKKLGKYSGRLVLEGFSLTPGNENLIQTETRMRAQSVSSFIKFEFPSIDDSNIAAFGLGNTWLNITNSKEKHITRELPLIKEGLILRLIFN